MEQSVAIAIIIALAALLFIGSYLVSSSFKRKKAQKQQEEIATSAQQ
jgi:hypothetical protein